MRKRLALLLLACLGTGLLQVKAEAPAPKRSAAAIIEKVNHNFLKIKDAAADITLDYSLILFGCSGLRRMQGKGYFKSPDKIRAEIEGVTYFATGNRIRKIDEKGKRYYIKLINALDFSPGFHAGLIPYNFYLKVIKDETDEIVIEGIPKPGVLKHVRKVIFHIDPQDYLLRKLDLDLTDRNLSGSINIDYEKIDGIWAPVGFEGTSAVALNSNFLIGIRIKLYGKNIRINTGLPDKLFDPGFQGLKASPTRC